MTHPIRAEYVAKLEAIANSSKWKIYTLSQPSPQLYVEPFVVFSDGKRQAYHMLVCTKKDLADTNKKRYFDTYMTKLTQYGLEFEITYSSYFEDLVFIKVHISKEVVVIFADTFDIPLAFQRDVHPKPKVFCKCMGNELTVIGKDRSLYKRAPNAIPGRKPTGVISSEAILVINKILDHVEFDSDPKSHNRGIEKLLRKNVFKDSFALHDGFPDWPKSGPVTDRQLLGKFWANIKACFKNQPLTQIEKYYGTETAFYFAWLGFYTTMLTIPAAFGALMFLIGLIVNSVATNNRIKEVCESNIILCPLCHPVYCKYVYYKSYCSSAKMAFLFDNVFTVVFAILMSVWATIFVELWKREEAVLRESWNVTSVEVDTTLRPQFEERAKHRKISPLTGKSVPYVPARIIILKYSLSFVTILLMIVCLVAAVFCIVLYKIALKLAIYKHGEPVLKKNTDMLTSATSAAIMAIFIIIFGKIYNRIALWLTHFENHRTQSEFDNSFIYKCYILSFVNNYGILFYTAFFKGKFFTFPLDKVSKSKIHLRTDYCNPVGCLVDVYFYLFFIMFFKGILCNVLEIVKPILAKKLKTKNKRQRMTQWEDDYHLHAMDRYYLIADYMEIVIQYGLVTFFVAAFPLAPLLAFINNVFEIRADGYKFIRWYRRPIPRKVSGLSAWNGILQAATYISVITNAFIIAFTSQFIPVQIYFHTKDKNLKGYINSTLSVFDTSDYSRHYPTPAVNVTSCHYIGKRYPPDHANRYQPTYEYYYELVMRLFFVVIFEHVILTFNSILAYAIPDIPFWVKEKMSQEKATVRDAKLKKAHETYLKKISESKINIHAD